MIQPQALMVTWCCQHVAYLARRREGQAHQRPVQVFQCRVTHESIVDRRYAGTPHEQHYTTEVKPIAKTCGGRGQVPYDVAAMRSGVSQSQAELLDHAPC